jgi:hypothetical protein
MPNPVHTGPFGPVGDHSNNGGAAVANTVMIGCRRRLKAGSGTDSVIVLGVLVRVG